jgi:type III pantothenate kinase
MLLVIEVGNTNTKVGVFEGDRLRAAWRLTTRREQTVDEYGLFIHTMLRARGIEPDAIRAVAISNVVPPLQQTLEWTAEQYFRLAPFSVEPGVNTAIVLAVDQPREVGADRVVNAVAAAHFYGTPVISINLGTATTFDCVNARGEFIGGAIAPGIVTAADGLIARAARLYRVELARPKEAIGRNTVTNLQSGIVYGYAALVDGLVERLRREMGGRATVVATGGNAPLIAHVAESIEHVNEHLTLEGIRLLHARHAERPRD